MGVITMGPLVDYLHYTPCDEVIVKNVKVQAVSFRISPDVAIWLDDFGTIPMGVTKKKWLEIYDEGHNIKMNHSALLQYCRLSTTCSKEFY